jgi:dipeptidyl aminopeptidase/acylaminoacyl peptidase
MPIAAPPRPPAPDVRDALDPLEALIKEARERARRRRLRYVAAGLAVAAAAFAVFAAGHRGSSSLHTRGQTEPPVPAQQPATSKHISGALTIIHGQSISFIGSNGRLKPVFDCRRPRGCLDLQSIAWSPEGNRLAFSVTGVGASSAYLGVHVYDRANHRDRQISRVDGFSLAWSPDGSHIAYVVSGLFPLPWGTIYVMNADGSHRRAIETGTSGADMSPSWSPDGRRLLFATNPLPFASRLRDSAVSVIDLDGSHRRLVARHALWPAWSPDGTRIAYLARCGGIKLMTPQGADATPAGPALGCSRSATRGAPVWSPDGRRLAVANQLGIFVVDLREGDKLAKLMSGFASRDAGQGLFGTATPNWRPIALKAARER